MSIKIFSRVLQAVKLNLASSLSTSALPREEKIKIGKYNVNYIKVGTGSHNVLCLPGIFGTIWTDFKAQVEGFDRKQFTLIAWDAPGCGKSTPHEKDFTLDYYEKDADYIYHFMKALEIKTYSLLGWSAGGVSGVIHAAKYPDTMRKLVIWGCDSFSLPEQALLYKNMKTMSNWSKSNLQTMTAIYGEEYFPKYYSKWSDAMVEIYKKKTDNLYLQCLQDVKCPTLIFHGEQDALVQKLHPTYYHKHIAGSRIHFYPEGKHNIHIKYAEDFNKRVQEFLLHYD